MSEFEITIDSSDDEDLETEETIRVLWIQTMKMHHLSICVNQPLEKVFKEISEIYSIPLDFVEIRYNDEPVSPSDSLDSLGFRIVHDSLYASKAAQAAIPATQSISVPGKNKLHIKCLVKDRKKPLDYYLSPRQNLQALLETLAKDLEVPLSCLKIKFDGDVVNAKDTPQSLDLDGGECFDVFINK
uniref:Ubiquitin-like domain-containing protein n=1 Tax=Lygus hesperus TaxID=30085 RepID=A0A0A9WEQ9_LYGHE